MKYLSEYQRSYYKRTPIPVSREVVPKRSSSSPSRRRPRSVPSSPVRKNSNENFAVVGPNEKFADSRLYRLKQPIKDQPRFAKSQEYAILGRNEKLENNVIYPLRKPVLSNSPRVIVRRRKEEQHSCGIQAELGASHDSRPRQRRDNRQSEYRTQYDWKTSSTGELFEQPKPQYVEPPPVVKPKETASVAVNTPARVEIDVNRPKKAKKRTGRSPIKAAQPKQDQTTEYRTRFVPKTNATEHAYSDDEGLTGNVDLGNEFRQKYPYGKLKRWKSEYQATYKPFWRFDYKNGKWYKDNSANENAFNPNLFWYKELMSTRKHADEYRANAEMDHFNPKHTLQLQTGFSLNNNCRAWDDDDSDTVISIDGDLERERLEGERRREIDAKRKEKEQAQPKKKRTPAPAPAVKNDQISQTEHQVDRVIYIDEPAPRQPSVATKAFVRNLASSSVQQHMSWDSESLCTQRTNSDLNSHRKNQERILHSSPIKKRESRGTRIYSPISTGNNGPSSPKKTDRPIPSREVYPIRPATSHHETSQATGRPSYETQPIDRRPYTSNNQYCTYPANRFKDEVTEYYYGDNENRRTPLFKQPDYRNKDDDVLSVNSARSLSSSCSLASQTLSRAQQNMNKYWGAPSSDKP